MSSALRPSIAFRLMLALAVLCAGAVLPAIPSMAQNAQVGQSTGLPLPRFVSTRSAPTNVRAGPGTQYHIAFTFLRPGLPVEITAEFDTWRRIRDVDGDEGWVHQNLVVGQRTALIAPWQDEGSIALRIAASESAAPRAWLAPQMLVTVRSCNGRFCEIRLNHATEGRTTTYQGFVAQEVLWGVYEGEVFD